MKELIVRKLDIEVNHASKLIRQLSNVLET